MSAARSACRRGLLSASLVGMIAVFCGIADDTTVGKANTITPLYVKGGSAENCTVAGCDPGSKKSPAVSVTSGALVNTISWGNAATSQLSQTGGTVSYCCYPEATEGENGNVAGDPKFSPRKDKAYHPRSSSPAINAGIKLDWMTADAKDLDGNPRVINGKPDMGCYETRRTGFVILGR